MVVLCIQISKWYVADHAEEEGEDNDDDDSFFSTELQILSCPRPYSSSLPVLFNAVMLWYMQLLFIYQYYTILWIVISTNYEIVKSGSHIIRMLLINHEMVMQLDFASSLLHC